MIKIIEVNHKKNRTNGKWRGNIEKGGGKGRKKDNKLTEQFGVEDMEWRQLLKIVEKRWKMDKNTLENG